MLKYKVGDLVEAAAIGEVDAIAHQANCFNTMNSGVAKAIRTRFPGAYEADCLTVKGDRSKLGDFSVYQVRDTLDNSPISLIYNLYGQYNYGYDAKGYTNYEALRGALMNMKEDLLTGNNLFKIGFPKIGAGLGGGDWDTIAGIIDLTFDERFEVTIYTLT